MISNNSKTIADLSVGERSVILDVSYEEIPLKLIEMGCIPGNEIELLQIAPFKGPLYLNINDSYIAIRKNIAAKIIIG